MRVHAFSTCIFQVMHLCIYRYVRFLISIQLFASFLSQLPHTLISPQLLFTILNVYMYVWLCMCLYAFSTCIAKATTQCWEISIISKKPPRTCSAFSNFNFKQIASKTRTTMSQSIIRHISFPTLILQREAHVKFSFNNLHKQIQSNRTIKHERQYRRLEHTNLHGENRFR